MTDAELLDLAAKAAGFPKDYHWNVHWLSSAGGSVKQGNTWVKWNPLTNDGDALRLAVKLKLFNEPRFTLYRLIPASVEDDPDVATRRAIVRTAAEIGKALSQKEQS